MLSYYNDIYVCMLPWNNSGIASLCYEYRGVKMNQSKQITDGALLIGVFIILLLIAMFVPAAILVAIFLLPVPFVLSASRNIWKPSFLIFAFVIFFTLLFESYFSLQLTLLF